jgi:hypothetical protein
MATIAQSSKAGVSISGRPAGSLRFDWAVIGLSTWFIGGVFTDGWAHTHIPQLETFFTPWHAVLYSGYAVVAIFLVAASVVNHQRGHAWGLSLPEGYTVSLIGAGIFAVGGMLDLTWHTIFGIEHKTEALLSPTHLTLALGAILMMSGPIRAAWRRADGGNASLVALLPAILGITYIWSLFTFFTQYADPIVHSRADVQVLDPSFTESSIQLGLASILIQSVIMMGAVLFIMRRWRLPFGAFTLAFGVNAALVSVLSGNTWGGDIGIAIFSALIGLIIDVFYNVVRPTFTRPDTLRLFAFGMPAIYYIFYFLALQLTKPNGIVWSVPLWTGSIVEAGIVGLLLSFLVAPPPVSQATE